MKVQTIIQLEKPATTKEDVNSSDVAISLGRLSADATSLARIMVHADKPDRILRITLEAVDEEDGGSRVPADSQPPENPGAVALRSLRTAVQRQLAQCAQPGHVETSPTPPHRPIPSSLAEEDETTHIQHLNEAARQMMHDGHHDAHISGDPGHDH